MKKWSVPLEWEGETAFILGGGPSLPIDRLPELRGRGRVIAVNNAGFVAPWADCLFYADSRWLEWNRDRLPEFEGERIVTRSPSILTKEPIFWLDYKPYRLSFVPSAVGGGCGGSSAINLAFLFGATRIVLLGFDYRPGNFHSDHRSPVTDPDHYKYKFVPAMQIVANGMRSAGVEVLNTCQDSDLKCFNFKSIDEILYS